MNPDAANAARCQDRPGTYEAWYVTVNDPAQRRGFWIRYTTLNPAAGVPEEAHSALWAFAFDRDDPTSNWGAKALFPLRALRVEPRPFAIRLQGAVLDRDGCSGELHTERGSARWELRWESREPPFPFLRPRWQMLSSVANIGAQPALTVSGTIEINGRTYRLQGAPGGQQHTWGTSHALAWNWGFASGKDFWVDGATSRVRSRFGRVLAGTAIGAKAGRELFAFNGPLQVLRTRGSISPEAWNAQAQLGERTLNITVTPRRQDLVGVTYVDPRGGARFCYHTEVADLELRLTRQGETLAQVSQPAGAAFEYASEIPLAGLPPLL
jgi:hypothetical protein